MNFFLLFHNQCSNLQIFENKKTNPQESGNMEICSVPSSCHQGSKNSECIITHNSNVSKPVKWANHGIITFGTVMKCLKHLPVSVCQKRYHWRRKTVSNTFTKHNELYDKTYSIAILRQKTILLDNASESPKIWLIQCLQNNNKQTNLTQRHSSSSWCH